MATKRRRKSNHDALISSLIWNCVGLILLVVLAVIAFQRGGAVSLGYYSVTVVLAFVVAFLSIIFVPSGSRWAQVGFWLLPVSLIVVVSLHWYGGGWFIGYSMGLLTAATVARRRHKRTTHARFRGRVLVTLPKKPRRLVLGSLTLTGFREALTQLDDELQPTMLLSLPGKRLDVFGTAAGPLVVIGSLDPDDDDAWRRLSMPGVDDPESEVTVPVGKVNGVYLKRSTVDVKLAKQAGEYFIRTGELDPSLVWEESQDVHDRLPPTRLKV